MIEWRVSPFWFYLECTDDDDDGGGSVSSKYLLAVEHSVMESDAGWEMEFSAVDIGPSYRLTDFIFS